MVAEFSAGLVPAGAWAASGAVGSRPDVGTRKMRRQCSGSRARKAAGCDTRGSRARPWPSGAWPAGPRSSRRRTPRPGCRCLLTTSATAPVICASPEERCSNLEDSF